MSPHTSGSSSPAQNASATPQNQPSLVIAWLRSWFSRFVDTCITCAANFLQGAESPTSPSTSASGIQREDLMRRLRTLEAEVDRLQSRRLQSGIFNFSGTPHVISCPEYKSSSAAMSLPWPPTPPSPLASSHTQAPALARTPSHTSSLSSASGASTTSPARYAATSSSASDTSGSSTKGPTTLSSSWSPPVAARSLSLR